MDPTKFDNVTKALATATSRRQALKTIAVTTLGSILGLAGIGTAFAKCHPAGHNCEENSTCCSQLCCIAAGQTEGVCCDTGQTCQNGTCCPCPAGTSCCPAGSFGDCCPSDAMCCPAGSAGPCCGVGNTCCPPRLVCVLLPGWHHLLPRRLA